MVPCVSQKIGKRESPIYSLWCNCLNLLAHDLRFIGSELLKPYHHWLFFKLMQMYNWPHFAINEGSICSRRSWSHHFHRWWWYEAGLEQLAGYIEWIRFCQPRKCFQGLWLASSLPCEEHGPQCTWREIWWCLFGSEATLWFGLFSYWYNHNTFQNNKKLWYGWVLETGIYEGTSILLDLYLFPS